MCIVKNMKCTGPQKPEVENTELYAAEVCVTSVILKAMLSGPSCLAGSLKPNRCQVRGQTKSDLSIYVLDFLSACLCLSLSVTGAHMCGQIFWRNKVLKGQYKKNVDEIFFS